MLGLILVYSLIGMPFGLYQNIKRDHLNLSALDFLKNYTLGIIFWPLVLIGALK